jgi:hypothetical protein
LVYGLFALSRGVAALGHELMRRVDRRERVT